MRALIIGGAGFVGEYLTNHIKESYSWDIVVTKLANETIKMPDGVEVIDLDILDIKQVKAVMESYKPNYIFHLAAQSSVALSWKNPSITVDVNIKGSLNVLDAIREMQNKPRILLVGSSEEYGYIKNEESPVKEETVLRPGNIYAATKAAQNMIGSIYAKAYDLDIIMVRAFNHIGPNQSPTFVVADFCKQVAEIEKGNHEPIIKVGNLKAKRDFTDVRDVVKAYTTLIKCGEKGETYNVGSGKSIMIEDILQMILNQSKTEIKVEIDEHKLRPIDIEDFQADIAKIKKDTKWEKTIPIENTISDTLNYWRNNIEIRK